MHISNAEDAVVDIIKLRDYCLSLDHPRGRHKAHVFASVLGLTADNAGLLQAQLLQAVTTHEAVPTVHYIWTTVTSSMLKSGRL